MTIGRFLTGLIFTLTVVALWSWQDGAAAGTIVLRLIAAAFIVQFGYFVGIFMMTRRETKADIKDVSKETERPAVTPHARRPSLDT